MDTLSIDLETFSSVNLKKSGLYKYVQSSDFEILLMAFCFNNGPVEIVDFTAGQKMSKGIEIALCNPRILKKAFNAPFEWYCLNKFYDSPLNQWRCTMLHALYCGLPGSLAKAAEALGLSSDKRKMGIGASLIRTFCIPCKPTKTNGMRARTLPRHEPEKWEIFKSYCKQDVVTEMAVDQQLFDFPVPDIEQRNWEIDIISNSCGVALDKELIDGAIYCSDVTTDRLMTEAIELSKLPNPKSVKQLKKWLEDAINLEHEGYDINDVGLRRVEGIARLAISTKEALVIESLNKKEIPKLLEKTESETIKRVLEIRQELSKTSVKKYQAMRDAICCDHRIRGLLQFYGANRTGRWAGRLVQIQNLPKNFLNSLVLAYARILVKERKVDELRMIYGNIPDLLSQLIRTAFVPSPGNVLHVADFSAIEARIIAWLANELWRIDVFATHGKIYEASASAMFGVPLELIVKGNPEYKLRAKGKIAELALGYGGSTGALTAMGALEMGLTEEELPDIVSRWRAANKNIVGFWYAVNNAAIEVMRTGRPVGLRGLIFAREGSPNTDMDFLTIRLLTGRKLYYPKPFLASNKFGREALHYYGTDQKTKQWGVIGTFGGKLVENLVQGIARDCLAEALLRLLMSGRRTVFSVHDEAIIDSSVNTEQELQTIFSIMGEPLPWAKGLILKADGFTTEFYRKED